MTTSGCHSMLNYTIYHLIASLAPKRLNGGVKAPLPCS